MSKYFDKFPTIGYDINRDGITKKVAFTNLLVRVGILREIKNNMFSYYDYVVPEGLSIEDLAEKYYGDPELHWVITLANDITDLHHDWPLNQTAFSKYIIAKYGSIAAAQAAIKRYEQVITRTHLSTNTVNTVKIEIQEDAYDDLAETSLVTYTLEDGTYLEELITKQIIYAYDWENDENEKKRQIKLIKKEYIPQIISEFNDLMYEAGNTTIRRGLRTLRGR